jgi:hypothetical protein
MTTDERGWKRLENGDVQITMSHDDWELLLIVMGTAAGAGVRERGMSTLSESLALVNRLNAGNPSFIQYEVRRQS